MTNMQNDQSGSSQYLDPYQSATGKIQPRGKLGPLAWVLIVSGVITFIFLIFSGLFFVMKSSKSSSKPSAASALFAGSNIGILELNGVIMDGNSKKFLKQLGEFEDDSSIKGIVIRLNSPGGSVAPSQEIYSAVKKSTKPIYVSMGSVAASGAYYVAMGAKKVFANAGTITGSIGVIMEFMNLEKLYDWAKVKRYSLKTGKFKDAGSDTRPMSEEERTLLQGMIDNVLTQFKSAVMEGRKLSAAQVTAVADGRIFSGEQAKMAQLVDELGTKDDAIVDLGKQLGIKGKPKTVTPDRHKKWLELLMEGGSDEESRSHGSIRGSVSKVLNLLGMSDESSTATLHPGIYWLWK